MEQDHSHHPLHHEHCLHEMAPLQACPELHMVFEEAQLYTDGSTITEGMIGDFLRGRRR